MSSASEPIDFADKSLTNRGVVTVTTPSRACGPRRTVTSVAATMKQTANKAVMAGLLVASLLTGAVSFAPLATAKGQEGGVVCTGIEMASSTCHPKAVQGTPIGSVPLGCQPSSNNTIACGRLGYHEFAAGPAPTAGSAVSGPRETLAAPPSKHSGVTASAQPQASHHASR
jgi:hypothetical protein